MAEKLPNKEFGKCQPQPLPLPPKEPVKHSGHVALLVMGTIAVGTTACALMPRPNCDPPAPGMAAPAQPNAACSSRSSSGGGSSHWSSRSSFFSSAPFEPFFIQRLVRRDARRLRLVRACVRLLGARMSRAKF